MDAGLWAIGGLWGQELSSEISRPVAAGGEPLAREMGTEETKVWGNWRSVGLEAVRWGHLKSSC